MSPRTPRTIQARAAWRRRHNRNRRPPKTGGPMALHLPDAIPRRALTYARTRLGTPGSVRATSPLSPAETSLARGPGWGRQRRGP